MAHCRHPTDGNAIRPCNLLLRSLNRGVSRYAGRQAAWLLGSGAIAGPHGPEPVSVLAQESQVSQRGSLWQAELDTWLS